MTEQMRNQDPQAAQLDHLARRLGRYNLVVAVAQRSRDLEERVDSVLVPSSGLLIRRALQEIAEGKVKVFLAEEKTEQDEDQIPQLPSPPVEELE